MNRPFLIFLLALFVVGVTSRCSSTEKAKVVSDSDLRIQSYEEESRIFLSKEVEETIDNVYGSMPDELPLCLHGHKIENGYRVTEVDMPWVQESSPSEALFNNETCRARDDYLGMIHNHGDFGACAPSDVDVRRFMYSEDALIEVITCQRFRGTEYFGIVIDTTLRKNLKVP